MVGASVAALVAFIMDFAAAASGFTQATMGMVDMRMAGAGNGCVGPIGIASTPATEACPNDKTRLPVGLVY